MRHATVGRWCWWWLDDTTLLVHCPNHRLVLIPDVLDEERARTILGPGYRDAETRTEAPA